MARFWKELIYLLLMQSFLLPLAFAKKGSEPLYTEPFDLAAGGTCLTRASQEGILFANPALLPLGGAWIRWFGIEMGTISDKDSASQGRKGLSGLDSTQIINQLFSRSLHLGQTFSLSFLNKNVGISAFDRIELDLEGSRYDASGLPAINLGVEAYAGGVLSAALQPVPWLSLGLTGKYIGLAEPDISLPIADPAAVQANIADPNALRQQVKYGLGTGADFGALFFAQGHTLDLSLALKLDDVGGTHLTGGADKIPQSAHVGLGLALHGNTSVLHLSLEHRDVLGVYEREPRFKKIYLGSRLMFRKLFGVAAGLYQGVPTFGIRSDLWFWKIGLTYYGREMGDYPGDKQRNLIMSYTTLGF